MKNNALVELWQLEIDGHATWWIKECSIIDDQSTIDAFVDSLRNGASIDACLDGLVDSYLSQEVFLEFMRHILDNGVINKEQFDTTINKERACLEIINKEIACQK